MTYQIHILNFLRTREIKITPLETECNIPIGTIRLALKGHRTLPEKHIKIISKRLKKYGYKQTTTK